MTVAYVERGYITSGAVLPDQRVSDGLVLFRIVEGAVTRIDVTGTKALDPDYVRDRLQRGIDRPVNIGEVERQLQLLLQDPNIARLNLELLPGVTSGRGDAVGRRRRGATLTRSAPPSPTTSRRASAASMANSTASYAT